jgi:hypothetical protein
MTRDVALRACVTAVRFALTGVSLQMDPALIGAEPDWREPTTVCAQTNNTCQPPPPDPNPPVTHLLWVKESTRIVRAYAHD